GRRWNGIGARYSISCRAMSVIDFACGPDSMTAVGRASAGFAPASGRQNASMRASSRRRSISALLTCAYASKSLQRRATGMRMRVMWRKLPSRRCSERSVARELAVHRAVRLRRLGAEAVDLVLLVRVEVALEPVPPGRVL